MRPAIADAIFWSALVCCVVAQIAILRSALARHEPPADAPASLPPVRRGMEALLPAVALAGVLALTWRAIQDRADASTDAAPPAAEVFPS
jgi:hypothetical protein